LALARVLVEGQPDLRCIDPTIDLNALRALDLGGLAATARLSAGGTMSEIGGEFTKLLAAARPQSLPRIPTVLLSDRQDLAKFDFEHDDGTTTYCDRRTGFYVEQAGSLADAIRKAAAERWPGIDCHVPKRTPHFTGRERLFARVQQFLAERESGYLV